MKSFSGNTQWEIHFSIDTVKVYFVGVILIQANGWSKKDISLAPIPQI